MLKVEFVSYSIFIPDKNQDLPILVSYLSTYMFKTIYPLIVLWALIGLCIWSINLTDPPKALPANAPDQEFSATRALAYLKQITKEPHAMGTPGHKNIRNYLIAELNRMGIQTQVQDTTVSAPHRSGFTQAHVYNIIGLIKGKNKGKAVLLVAHYDSQPNSLGAGDDGAGIAAMLETARAIKTGEPLDNDLILLMTDGEEYNLLGARAFMKHPLAQRVGLLMNMEARGNSGPSSTFEISPENGWVVQEFAKVAPYPLASSLFYEVYKLMPNDTDFTIFKSANYTGLNSAFVDGFVSYHAMTDSYDNLNVNSLQHHGSNLLALTKHFGNISLEKTKSPDKTFFNPAGTWLIHYSTSLNFIWIFITSLLLAAVIYFGIILKIFKLKQFMISIFLYLLMFIIIGVIFLPFNVLVTSFLENHHSSNGVYASNIVFLGYALIAIAVFLLLSRIALRWVNVFSLFSGACLLIFIIAVIQVITLPSTAYLFMFPLIFCLTSALVIFRNRLYLEGNYYYPIVLTLGLLPSIFMLVPLTSFLFIVFALQLPIASMLLLLIFMGLGFPLLIFIGHSVKWRNISVFPLICLLTAVVLLGFAIKENKPNTTHPLKSEVGYYLDTDHNKAYWATGYLETDEWNKQFFNKPYRGKLDDPTDPWEYLKSNAEAAKVDAPVAKLLSEEEKSGQRILHIRLHSPRQAAHFDIMLVPEADSTLKKAFLNKEPLVLNYLKSADGAKVVFTKLYGLPESKEADLDLILAKGSKLKLILSDTSIGLPEELVKIKRPDYVIPEQGPRSNVTVVKKSFVF